MMSDARSILDSEFGPEAGPSARKKEPRKRGSEPGFKRPEGMHRELYALLMGDSKEPPPLISTESTMMQGYKQNKAKLGLRRARSWKWMEFTNPGRADGFKLRHWRREVDAGKDYPFAKFNKQVTLQSYTDQEYAQHLHHDDWSKAETDHLFDLCRRFDLRFIVIQDRWDRDKFSKHRSVEDLKERYYSSFNTLSVIHAAEPDNVVKKNYDAVHERKRKDQLIKLYNRTPAQLEEEQELMDEFRKIEQRKKERERKTQDLQKLITDANTGKMAKAGNSNSTGQGQAAFGGGGGGSQQRTSDGGSNPSRSQSRSNRKKVSGSSHRSSGSKETSSGSVMNLAEAGIKFPEIKNPGPSLRSQRMKLPGSVGQKKSKAIEQLLHELNIDLRPMALADVCQNFNELRSDMVLLYELKMALANSEFELQTLKHQVEALKSTGTEDVTVMPADSTPAQQLPQQSQSQEQEQGMEVAEDETPQPLEQQLPVTVVADSETPSSGTVPPQQPLLPPVPPSDQSHDEKESISEVMVAAVNPDSREAGP